MTTGISAEATENADRFYTMVKSLRNFDSLEIKGVVESLLSTTPEENCFIGTYYRARSNIDSVLEFQHSRHFQAAAMLARALFELAVDMRLLEVVPNSTVKMNAFIEVEKLRCARKALAFKTSNPQADVDTTSYSAFITHSGSRVDGVRESLWPNIHRLHHWSGLPMPARVAKLRAPFDQLYEVDYPRLSWYTHPGLTGIANLPAEAFTYICSYAFKLAADSYSEVLQTLIRKFGLVKTNDKIQHKLNVARIFPFTNTPEEVDVLARSIQ